ncbi:phospholipase D-like domain-containing protein [Pleomorphomonas sp. JP5]|uniref:phospholipase D-like domain-containing protein n=1 Tax=Pleomorphomonas sp. JP5 TaxID=2942998 RepID=UPI0020446783|nr:phospholipase D-like domain-containing protein [Pleomorphomonas sp. JP5]MCM5559397.1 phospholipase D-like domain-containing protein [Pleomorphomonas sp. JP5]
MAWTEHLAVVYFLVEWSIRLVMVVVVPLRRPPEAARSWLLLVFFLPLPALVLYRLIGRPRFPAWRQQRFAEAVVVRRRVATSLPRPARLVPGIADLAERLGEFPVTGASSLELIGDYEQSIDRLVADIDAAAVSVHLLTYIFADDATGRKVAAALGRAVRRGVEVRVLIDAIGSRPWAKRTLAMLGAEGVQCRLALPVRWWTTVRRARADLRNHRKITVIDGRLAYVGSQNIVDRDFRRGIVNDELVARLEGAAAATVAGVFASDWYLETREILPAPPVSEEALSPVQIMPSGPDYGVPGFERLLVALIHAAKTQVTLVSPYLIPDEALLAALQTAAYRGVVIDLVVSRVVDQRLVRLAQRSFYDELMSMGVRIHRYRDHLLHAKHVSIDGRIGVIGSGNADLRSFMLNAEVSMLLYDPAHVADLVARQAECMAQSDRLDLREWRRRPMVVSLAENLARLVSPLL